MRGPTAPSAPAGGAGADRALLSLSLADTDVSGPLPSTTASTARGAAAAAPSPGRYTKLRDDGSGASHETATTATATPTGGPAGAAADHRKLGALAVAIISFGSVAGGPYGIEAAVGAAGALPTLVGCAALAFLWSAPQALVTAELATAFPSNGGYITWGVRGLGPVLGFVNAANCVASAVCNLPLYPVLFASYLAVLDPALSPGALFAIKAAALALTVGLNLAGIQAVEVASLLFTVIVQTPFILMPAAAAVYGAPSFAWAAGPSSVVPDWRASFAVFVSTLCWNAQGWVNVGNIASDVRNPRVSYPAGSALAVLLVSLNYIYPVWVCSALAPDPAAWDTGYFATIGSAVAPWLGVYTTLASMFSSANNFLPQLGTTSRALRYCALYRMLPLPGLGANWRWRARGGGGRLRCCRGGGAAAAPAAGAPATPAAVHAPASAPGVAILLQGALCGVLMNFSFDVLVIVNVLFYNVGLMLQFGAFLALKHSRPDIHRPFVVPGGLPGAWAAAAAFAGVLCLAFYAAAVSSPWAMLILLVSNLVFLLGGLAWARWGFTETLLDEVDAAEARADADAMAAAACGAAASAATAGGSDDDDDAALAHAAGVGAAQPPHERAAGGQPPAHGSSTGPLAGDALPTGASAGSSSIGVQQQQQQLQQPAHTARSYPASSAAGGGSSSAFHAAASSSAFSLFSSGGRTRAAVAGGQLPHESKRSLLAHDYLQGSHASSSSSFASRGMSGGYCATSHGSSGLGSSSASECSTEAGGGGQLDPGSLSMASSSSAGGSLSVYELSVAGSARSRGSSYSGSRGSRRGARGWGSSEGCSGAAAGDGGAVVLCVDALDAAHGHERYGGGGSEPRRSQQSAWRYDVVTAES